MDRAPSSAPSASLTTYPSAAPSSSVVTNDAPNQITGEQQRPWNIVDRWSVDGFGVQCYLRGFLHRRVMIYKIHKCIRRRTETCVATVNASRDFFLLFLSERGGGEVRCQTFSFALFSLFSRPRAGLTTV